MEIVDLIVQYGPSGLFGFLLVVIVGVLVRGVPLPRKTVELPPLDTSRLDRLTEASEQQAREADLRAEVDADRVDLAVEEGEGLAGEVERRRMRREGRDR